MKNIKIAVEKSSKSAQEHRSHAEKLEALQTDTSLAGKVSRGLAKKALGKQLKKAQFEFAPNTALMSDVHTAALQEDKARENERVDETLNQMFLEVSEDLESKKQETGYDDLSSYEKIDYIRKFAIDDTNRNTMPFIKAENDGSALIVGSSRQQEHLLSLGIDVTVLQPMFARIKAPRDGIIEVDFYSSDYNEPLEPADENSLSTFETIKRLKTTFTNQDSYALAVKQSINGRKIDLDANDKALLKIVVGEQTGATMLRYAGSSTPYPEGTKMFTFEDGKTVQQDPNLVGYRPIKQFDEPGIERVCNDLLFGAVHLS